MAVVSKKKKLTPFKITVLFCFTVAGYTRASIDIERPINAYFPGYYYAVSYKDHLPQNLI